MYKKYIIDFGTILLALFTLFPIFTINNNVRVIVAIASFLILFNTFPSILRAKDIPFSKLVIIFILIIIISLFNDFLSSMNNIIFISIHFVFLSVFIYYRELGFNKMKNIIIVLILSLTVAAIQTIIILNNTANYARLLAKNNDDIEVIGLSGGYGLVYASVLAFFSYFILSINAKNINLIYRIFLFISSLILSFFIWKAGYFLALLLLLIGIAMFYFGRKGFSIIKSFFIFSILFLLFILFNTLIKDVVVKSVKGTEYENKVTQIFLSSEDSFNSRGDEFEERNNRYSRDISLIKQYSLVGCWDIYKTGKHSYILDSLAHYGLILGLFFIYIIFFIPYQIIRISVGVSHLYSIIIVSLLFVFLLLNSLTMSISPILLLLYPYTIQLLNQNE